MCTPNSQHIVKSYGRGSKEAAVRHTENCPVTRKYLIRKVYNLVNKELHNLCSDEVKSVLQTSDVQEFTWDRLLNEIKAHAPMYFAIMQGCTHTVIPRNNRNAVIGICTAILLKHKFHKMSLVQKIISLIMYAGHRYAMLHFIM